MAFFATSHGENACDGVGGTIKHLAAYAGLQRPISDQILTPLNLFEFAKKKIAGITTFFVNTEDVEKAAQFLRPRFKNAPKIKGTRKNHQFMHVGNDIVMIRVSGMSEVINLRATPHMNIEGLQDIVPGLFYACKYDNEWYFGIVNYVCYENDDVNVKFMHPNGPSTQFFWPNRDDTCWIPLHDIICKATISQFYWVILPVCTKRY